VKRDQLAREGRTFSSEEEQAMRQPILDQYEHEGSPTTPPRACGMTGSSIGGDAAGARARLVAALTPHSGRKVRVFRMDNQGHPEPSCAMISAS